MPVRSARAAEMAVRIDRVVTRSGDDGQTFVPGGGRVPKTAARIRALGVLDELNAAVGYVLAQHDLSPDVAGTLRLVQQWLFEAGAAVATAAARRVEAAGDANESRAGGHASAGGRQPAGGQTPAVAQSVTDWPGGHEGDAGAAPAGVRPEATEPDVWAERTRKLEEVAADALQRLPPLDGFVVPGGRPEAAGLHWVRAVARRAEVALWEAAEEAVLPSGMLRWVNRLSDVLFVYARLCNDGGRMDVLWRPGPIAEGDT
ncbi:MAG: ATP:cob(I)alamin adenosyltransferase [Planctomycetota bacterium]|nr:MAG: ATP:cob(I)alamin adenosyltransferase [Planctomycetota bacterium]